MRARIDAEAVARALSRLGAARDEDPDRFEPLGLILDDLPEAYDPAQTPAERDA